METVTSECPSGKTLAAFVDGNLDSEARQGVLAHAARCSRCAPTLLGATARAKGSNEDGRLFRKLIIGVVAAVALTCLSLFLRERLSVRDAAVEALVDAAERLSDRPFDGRLSGGFSYKPTRSNSRDARMHSDESTWAIAAAAAQIDKTDSHARGIAFLLMGDFDKAVVHLERATRTEPQNAVALSDLSTAYNERAKARHYVPDYAAALDTAEHAWRLKPTAESAWNRAIALSSMGLPDAAARAWGAVLQGNEDDVAWHREAQKRRADLHRVTVLDEWRRIAPQLIRWNGRNDRAIDDAIARFPAQSLIEFDTAILPRWAKARRNGDSVAAATEYRLARRVATALADSGERFALDAVTAIDRACRSETTCRSLAEVQVRYDDARQAIEAHDFNHASAVLADVIERFDEFHTPYAIASRFERATCLLHENRFGDARAAGETLQVRVDGRQYRTLEARVRWLAGLAMLHDARPEESIENYAAARQLFIDGRDAKFLASVELRLADAFEYAGDRDAAMVHRLETFDAMRTSGDTSELYLALFEAGTSISQQGWLHAADLLLSECVREAVDHRQTTVAALASMWRSTLSSRLGDLASAAEQARMAAVYSGQTSDPGQHALIAANLSQLVGTEIDTRRPVAGITETIRFFKVAGNRAWLPQLLRQRALIRRGHADVAGAETDFREAINISEEVLGDAAAATMREGFTADARANYEDLIRLLLDKGATRDALAYAERARLIGQGHPGKGDVLSPLSGMSPMKTAAVFEVEAHSVTVWLVKQNSVIVFRSHHPFDVASRIASAAEAKPSEETLSTLYDLLVRRWISHVATESDLMIVPPPQLAGVPFPALLDRRNGRALMDDYAIAIAPSLASAAEEPVTLLRSDPVLIVGDPAYQRLPRLPRSREEAVAIAKNYEHVTLLLDERATAENLVKNIDETAVFHFAGHAIANDLAPEMSSLMVAAENGEDVRVYVHELPKHRLPLKLVVLSACSTATNPSRGARGTLNLGRAFVDRGARAVIGTLRPIPDDIAATFSVKLHEALARGENVQQAMRSAQLHLRSAAKGDLTWASFCLVTGNPARKEVHAHDQSVENEVHR